MKIIVLDGFTMNPGDLSWQHLEKLGDVIIYDRTSPQDVKNRIAGADIVLTNKTAINAATINSTARLKYIGVMATGCNMVDMEVARARNIIVTNVPAYSTASVTQLVFAFMLELVNHTMLYSNSVHEDDWVKSRDFSYQLEPLIELQHKILGIIGLGQIGQSVAKIALAFGMQVIASHKHPERDKMYSVRFKDEETVFREADFISLHCPLNEQNKEFVNHDLLEKMKSSAYLINTSRGPLICEQDLADALNDGRIAGAALDVLSTEPPDQNNPLLTAKNCIITPHVGWATYEARSRLMQTVVNNIQSFLNGAPINVIS